MENKMQKFDGIWTRKYVEEHPNHMFIFTDNTNRDSGKTLIPKDSWYAKKYGEGKHYPSMTSAVIRGLDNAFPISTQHWYDNEHRGKSGRWTDADIEEFKEVIDDEFKTIEEAWDSGKYEKMYAPNGGFFKRAISQLSKERTPLIYDYLYNKLLKLYIKVK